MVLRHEPRRSTCLTMDVCMYTLMLAAALTAASTAQAETENVSVTMPNPIPWNEYFVLTSTPYVHVRLIKPMIGLVIDEDSTYVGAGATYSLSVQDSGPAGRLVIAVELVYDGDIVIGGTTWLSEHGVVNDTVFGIDPGDSVSCEVPATAPLQIICQID